MKFILSQFWRLGSLRLRHWPVRAPFPCFQFGVLYIAFSRGDTCYILTRQKTRKEREELFVLTWQRGRREQTHSGNPFLQKPYSSALTWTPPSTVALDIKFPTHEFWGTHVDHSRYVGRVRLDICKMGEFINFWLYYGNINISINVFFWWLVKT